MAVRHTLSMYYLRAPLFIVAVSVSQTACLIWRCGRITILAMLGAEHERGSSIATSRDVRTLSHGQNHGLAGRNELAVPEVFAANTLRMCQMLNELKQFIEERTCRSLPPINPSFHCNFVSQATSVHRHSVTRHSVHAVLMLTWDINNTVSHKDFKSFANQPYYWKAAADFKLKLAQKNNLQSHDAPIDPPPPPSPPAHNRPIPLHSNLYHQTPSSPPQPSLSLPRLHAAAGRRCIRPLQNPPRERRLRRRPRFRTRKGDRQRSCQRYREQGSEFDGATGIES